MCLLKLDFSLYVVLSIFKYLRKPSVIGLLLFIIRFTEIYSPQEHCERIFAFCEFTALCLYRTGDILTWRNLGAVSLAARSLAGAGTRRPGRNNSTAITREPHN